MLMLHKHKILIICDVEVVNYVTKDFYILDSGPTSSMEHFQAFKVFLHLDFSSVVALISSTTQSKLLKLLKEIKQDGTTLWGIFARAYMLNILG